jgi:hypothetical protein
VRPVSTAAICVLLSVAGLGQQPSHTDKAAERRASRITSFKVERPNLVITGSYLSRVKICGVPSGTEIPQDACDPLGEAKLTTAAGENECWVMRLPPPGDGWSVTEVYAEAYGANNHLVASKSLPYMGVNNVNEALWPQADPKVFSHQQRIEANDAGKRFVFPDNRWIFFIVLDSINYPRTDFSLSCRPKYATGQATEEWSKKVQDQMGWPGTAFYTSHPGTCTISNRDFRVTIKVLHGDSRQ